jgi:iron complex outermembrane receptor protein
MPESTGRGLLFYGTAAVGLLAGGGAWAAQATETAQGASGSTTLQEVIVTVQKRAERLVDVPQSVAVVSAQAAENRGIRNLQDITQAVAGVQIGFGGYAVQPAVRGVTSTNPLLENNVAVYIDGIYQQDQNTINAEMADLESIQILKGPQGTLYGRNATGGAILYTTLPPSKTWRGDIDTSYGNFNDWTAKGYISGPISDRVRFSVAGFGRQSDGYYDRLSAVGEKIGNAAPLNNYTARLKLQADLTDELTGTLGWAYTDLSDPRGNMFTYEEHRNALPPKVGRLYDMRTSATRYPTKQIDDQNEGSLALVWRTPIGTLTSHTAGAFRKEKQAFEFDGSYADLSYSNLRIHERNIQESVDYDITAIKHLDLTIGGTYWNNILHYYPSIAYTAQFPYSGGVPAQTTNQEEYTEAWAVFAQASYHVTSKLTLSAGGRYSDEERAESYSVYLNGLGHYAAPPVSAKDEHFNFGNFSPQGSIRYEVSPGSVIYAAITEGYRSGQPQVVALNGVNKFLPVKPETIVSYEIGYKLDRRFVQATAAAYYYDYTDIQLSLTQPNPLNPATPSSITSNAPKATIYGVEGEVKWAPVTHLSFDLNGAWVHARYGTFVNASGVGFNAATGHNIAVQTQDWTGDRMPRAPEFSGALAVSYEFQNVAGGTMMATTNVYATTEYPINNPSIFGPFAAPGVQHKERFVQPGYALANASLTWNDATHHYTVGVYMNNITNVYYKLSYSGGTFGDYHTWAPPRTYGIRLGYKY